MHLPKACRTIEAKVQLYGIVGSWMTQVVGLQSELSQVVDYWAPRTVGTVNETALKVVRLKGTFERHMHEAEDECFLVLDGQLSMRFDDEEKVIGPGEFIIVPRGVYHEPHCDEEVRILLIEPASTVQYGDADEGLVKSARATAEP